MLWEKTFYPTKKLIILPDRSFSSITLLLIGKIPGFHILDVTFNRGAHCTPQIRVLAQKPGPEFLGDAQHIVNYQNLSVYLLTCTDTYGGDGNRCGYLLGKFGGDFLQ